MLRSGIIVFALCLLLPSALKAQFRFDEPYREMYYHVIDLKFEKARLMIALESKQEPENLIPLVLENYIDFLTVFISEDRALFDRLEQNKKARLELLYNASDQNPYKRVAQATVLLHWAFVRLKFTDQYYTSAFEIRKAFLLLEENQVLFPQFPLNKIGLGVLYAMVGSIPPNFQWIVRLASMRGSVVQGTALLYEAYHECSVSDEFKVFTSEILFYLSYIEMNLQPNKEGAHKLAGYFDAADDVPMLMLYAQVNLLMHIGDNDKALQLLNSRPVGTEYYSFAYLDYLKAECMLRKLDVGAGLYYTQFINTFKGSNFIVDAKRKLAWIQLLQNNEDGYNIQMAAIDPKAISLVDADKQAVKEKLRQQSPDTTLLKARLLFDGGYYESSLEVLKNANMFAGRPVNLQIEYNYRLARVHHEMGNLIQAILFYEKTIRLGSNLPLYFGANAALKLGEIYEVSSNPQKAELNYRLCLSMNPEEYKTGIHMRAKAGIGRIENEKKSDR